MESRCQVCRPTKRLQAELDRENTEIAAEMDKSEVAVRKLLSRDRARLALLLEQE